MLVPEHQIFIMPGYVDMRKAINGLSVFVTQQRLLVNNYFSLSEEQIMAIYAARL